MFQPFSTKRRRSGRLALIIFGVLIAISVGFLVFFGSKGERIRQYTVEMVLQEDGTALVREVIDYDFGSNSKHGIFRDLPGYEFAENDPDPDDEIISQVRVESATAPDQVELTGGSSAEIRVGDPNETVSGAHRYVLEYRITGLTSSDGQQLSYDAIGDEWQAPIDSADITMTVPFALDDVACYRGYAFDENDCDDVSAGDSTITVHTEGLDEGEGVTVDGARAGPAPGPVTTELSGEVDLNGGDTGMGWLLTLAIILGIGTVGYVVSAIPVIRWSRRAGRDVAWAGGGIEGVFGGPGLETAPIDDAVADQQVTMQFEPPRDLTPAQGGVLLTEKVANDQRVAWLTQYAIDGTIEISDNGKLLRWTAPDDRWSTAPAPLQKIFAGRHEVSLREYDEDFAKGWKMIDDELKRWRETCGLWDMAAEKRHLSISHWLTVIGVLTGIAGAVLIGMYVDTSPLVAIIAAAVSSLLVGAGISAAANSDELPIRTPQGFARRQLVEGFRRFFEMSEGKHAEQAAERGELRMYSAWAAALGELDRWNAAMSAAALPPTTPGLNQAMYMSAFSTATTTASTAPSSSSGGGYSGGGSVGGGGGGGGGGSW